MKKICVILAFVLIAGCVSSGNSGISNISAVDKKLSESGSIGKSEIEKLYGEPNIKYLRDGFEVYEYKYISVSNSALGYLPIIGMWFGRTYETSYLYAYFDKSGVLAKFDTVKVEGNYPIK